MGIKIQNWGPALFLLVYQSLFLAGLPICLIYHPPGLGILLLTFFLFFTTGISITGGYHRLYSHKAYRTNKYVEAVILFFSTMSAQGSALRWCYDHRIHHAHVDTDQDPYSINKGFWYAHCLWLLDEPKEIERKVVPDLMKNKLVMFQHHHYPLLVTLTNVLAVAASGWLFDDYVGAFFMVFLGRLFLLHHCTWFINSLAHTWGDKPFCQEQTAVDNYFLSLLTFGEGYHNYHHTFANDYRNGIRWYHFDPTKWTIWLLEKMGLAYSLKRMDWLTISKRMVLESKTQLQDKVSHLFYVKKEELQNAIEDISNRFLSELNEFIQLNEKYRELKKTRERQDIIKELQMELRELKLKLNKDWHLWTKISKHIMSLEPLQAIS